MTEPSIASTSQSQISCFDPATGDFLGEVPTMGEEEVRAAVQAARRAQWSWAKTNYDQRRSILSDILDYTVRHTQDICRIAARDSGKTMVDAAMGEVFPVCEKLKYTIAEGERILAPESRSSGFLLHKSAQVHYQPLGVIGVICPWNFPFHNLFCPTIPALFSGNAVVAKVSEWTSWSAAEYIEIFHRVLRKHGFSSDLVQIVTGYGETGSHLVRSGVDKIFFTGSPENGQKVMQAASESLTPVVLELGGKDPLIVCDDANLEQAADAAMLGVFTACGQMCVGAERIYVFDQVHDAFIKILDRRVAELRQGPPLGSELVDLGATTMPAQLEIIESLVQDAVDKGAQLIHGGKKGAHQTGQYYEPTLLTEVNHTMRITQEECFGPVMVIMRVQDETEVIRLANDSRYGLGSSVFTRNQERGIKIAKAIRSGMSVVNDYGIAYMMQDLPFGGVGISGFGRINGPEGLRACCHQKAIVSDRVSFGKSFAVHPIRAQSFDLVENAIQCIYGRQTRNRAQAAIAAARNLFALRNRKSS